MSSTLSQQVERDMRDHLDACRTLFGGCWLSPETPAQVACLRRLEGAGEVEVQFTGSGIFMARLIA
jgi:hypothetical protein